MAVENVPEAIEGHGEEIGAELTVRPAAPTTLFRTDDPVQVLERATETADALREVLKQQGLTTRIQGKDHVNVEGWQTLGAMLGVTPVCEWTRPVDKGWEARVEAQTLDGRVIGAAEAQCLHDESRWKNADDYAVRSMAQTRATSKALGSVLRFVVTLAGYSGTPAEEMPGDSPAPEATPAETHVDVASDEQVKQIIDGLKAMGAKNDDLRLMLGAIGAEAPKINRRDSVHKALRALTPRQAEQLLGRITAEVDSGK